MVPAKLEIFLYYFSSRFNCNQLSITSPAGVAPMGQSQTRLSMLLKRNTGEGGSPCGGVRCTGATEEGKCRCHPTRTMNKRLFGVVVPQIVKVSSSL